MRGGAGEEGPRPGQHCSLNSTSTHRDVLFLTFFLMLILSPSIVQVSDTRMNQDSSRSHQVVRIFVESRPAHWGGAVAAGGTEPEKRGCAQQHWLWRREGICCGWDGEGKGRGHWVKTRYDLRGGQNRRSKQNLIPSLPPSRRFRRGDVR